MTRAVVAAMATVRVAAEMAKEAAEMARVAAMGEATAVMRLEMMLERGSDIAVRYKNCWQYGVWSARGTTVGLRHASMPQRSPSRCPRGTR